MTIETIEEFSPAKINLFLGIVGKRKDGYHELLSLVTRVAFGDHLRIKLVAEQDSLECDYPGLPLDSDNIIIQAVKAFRRRYAFENGVKIFLDKKIPLEAGLGGGSSNAVAALKGLNQLLGKPLSQEDLMEIAITLGSDCPLFFLDGPAFVRGRGEIVDNVDAVLKKNLIGQKILIFKPKFSINTQWAFLQMTLNTNFYIDPEAAEFFLKEGIDNFLLSGDLSGILYNNFEKVIFEKYKELGEFMKNLKMQFAVEALLSGSGSACFCVVNPNSDVLGIKNMIKDTLGKDIFIVETTIY